MAPVMRLARAFVMAVNTLMPLLPCGGSGLLVSSALQVGFMHVLLGMQACLLTYAFDAALQL